jgi:hypothetical protein
LYLKICNSSENVSTRMLWKIRLVLFLLISFICTSIQISFDFLIWDRHNLFEGRSPIMFRGRHEKVMYYFFQVLFKVFLKFVIWLELSLFDCVTEDWRYVWLQKKTYKIYRSFKRSYIDQNILYYNKNKIQIQMSILFPNIFETK